MTKTTPKTSDEIKARAKIFVTKKDVISPNVSIFAAYLHVLYKLNLANGKKTHYSIFFEETRLFREMVHEIYGYLSSVKKSRKPPRHKPKREFIKGGAL